MVIPRGPWINATNGDGTMRLWSPPEPPEKGELVYWTNPHINAKKGPKVLKYKGTCPKMGGSA
jgi:hypothetical protein